MPEAERVLAANLNVFTVPELDPRVHDVRSWAWSPLAELEADARAALRGVAYGDEIAARYVAGKRVLEGSGRVARVRWLAGEVVRARRVLVGAAPPAGRDRSLWLLIVALARLTRTPLLVYSETWLDPLGVAHAPRRALDRVVAALATTILVPGRVHAAHYRRHGYGAKVRVIAAPYATPAVVGRKPGPPELLFVGRAMPLKGLDRLLDLVDALDAEGTRVRLVALLGDPGTQFAGADASYATACLARLHARDPALTEVHTTRVDPAPFYRRATLLVVPNRLCRQDRVPGESWNRVVPEALAAGLPVVSTDAVPSAVEHVAGDALVPWADDAALRAAVRRRLP